MRTFYQDLRYGLRWLRHSPGFAAVAVLTLGLGIAVNTTVFSWIDSILLDPYPGSSDSGRLAVVEAVETGAPNGAVQLSYLDYLDYRRHLNSLAGIALHREDVFAVGDATHSQAVWGELVSGNYFSVLGVRPALGRMFTPEEDGDKPGAFPVAVIGYGLWRSRFHGDPAVVGKTVRINRHELTVVGVAPPEFRGTMSGLEFSIWVPMTMGVELGMVDQSSLTSRRARQYYGVARLAPGVDVSRASAEVVTLAKNLELLNPKTNTGVSAVVLPPWRFHSAAPELLLGPLRILMVVSLLVLLIVCANVANLLLARCVSRRKELSIRAALGAGAPRLARQLLSETLLLAGAGALFGLLLAPWMASLLPLLIPKIGFTVALGFHLSARVLAVTILACLVTALLAGAAPVAFWMRSDVSRALNEGGRGGSQGAHSHRMRGMLVIGEVALAAVALVGAGLFVRSFRNAASTYPGFDPNHLTLVRFYHSGNGLSTLEAYQFQQRLRDRLLTNPRILDVSYSDYPPLGASAGPYSDVLVEGYEPEKRESMEINCYEVAPGYFATLRTPLLEGRDFTDKDDRQGAPVMIVNQSFARRYFHGGPALGRKVRYRREWATVVGVARDSKYFNVAESPRPHFFVPLRRYLGNDDDFYAFIRTAGDSAPVIAGLRRDVADTNPNAAAFDAMPITEWMGITLMPQKVAASMLGALGLIALLLAAVGLYSVMAYAVSQRTQEIGIRMALGARPFDVLGDVLGRGLSLTAAGLALGMAAALAVTHLVSGMLVRVSALDPLTFTAAGLFLALIAIVASYVPAWRATKVEPMTALRCD